MTSVSGSYATSAMQAITKPSTTARAADGDYKIKGPGHETRDADGDYKPAAVASPAASRSSAATLSAVLNLTKGG